MRHEDGSAAVNVILGALLALGGVILIPGAKDALPQSPWLETELAAREWPELYKEVQDGVMRVETTTCTGSLGGSGALIAPDKVLTAAHVVRDAQTVQVRTDITNPTAGVVIGYAPEADLALIHLRSPSPGHVFRLSEATPDIGSTVVALGYPLAGQLSMTAPGTVSALNQDVDYAAIDMSVRGLMQLSLATNQGNSGGPVLDETGALVGVISGQAATYLLPGRTGAIPEVVDVDGIKYATPAAVARAHLATWQAQQAAVPVVECQVPGENAQGGGNDSADGGGSDEQDTSLVTSRVDSARARDVVAMLSDYAGGISDGDYDRAYSQLSEERRQQLSPDRFRREQQSVVFYDVVLLALASEGENLLAQTTFKTTQDATAAPGGTGWTCTIWQLTWRLGQGGPHGWSIQSSEQSSYTKCPEELEPGG